MKTSQILRQKYLEKAVKKIKRCANQGWINYGTCQPEELQPHTFDFVVDGVGIRIIFTRDSGHHTGGWFKNPDYERCYHLSLSYRSPDGVYSLPANQSLSLELAQLFFGDFVRWLWIEGPFGEEGKRLDVWHYRLFCDPAWQPIFPRKEVYSKEFTEKGWKSFSDIHGCKPNMVQEA